MSNTADVETVERIIPAPPEAIFALLDDPANHRLIDGSGQVRDAKQGSQRLTLGSTFGMSMKVGIPYSMVSTIIEYEPARRIAWQTRSPLPLSKHFVGGRIWRYELEPVEGGTRVRESWDISQEKLKFVVRSLRKATIEGMKKTLERIEEVVASRA